MAEEFNALDFVRRATAAGLKMDRTRDIINFWGAGTPQIIALKDELLGFENADKYAAVLALLPPTPNAIYRR